MRSSVAWLFAASAFVFVVSGFGRKPEAGSREPGWPELPGVAGPEQIQNERDWPTVTRETRPWTRWWWHGSAVDRRNLTAELDALRTAGIGGVEITPIYGVRGEETRFIPYLSSTWVAMLEHAVREGNRLDVGVDLATGTGWPFGGPWVGDDEAPRTVAHKTWTLEAGRRLAEPVRLEQTPLLRALGNQIYEVGEIRPGERPPVGTAQRPQTRADVRPLQISDILEPVTANKNLQALAIEQVKYPRDLPLTAVVAYGESGAITDLTGRVTRDGILEWTPTERTTVYALFAGWHGKLVERAAPGGEGHVIDHFSRNAIRAYLARFDRALATRNPPGPRAFFNDSYEVDDASGQGDWTPRLFDEFQKRRGYDLRRHLPALFGRATADLNARVIADYRETLSDLLLETFTAEWAAWARRRGSIVRNQAHGSPANLLDLYAASDIPETEGTDLPRFKWATSAANVAGRRLVSAEAATWLGEHFRTTLADVRAALDHFFVGGVNHIVYHGTAYSPDDAPWPGWQFYAAVEFNRRNAWWDDFATLNQYVTRAQSFLQSGRADHDVLLYFPFHDAVAAQGTALLTHFGGANRATAAAGFEEARAVLQARGFTYDYISDRQLQRARVEQGRLMTEGGGRYGVLVLPSTRYIPSQTLESILELARQGADVVIWKDWPADVAGLADLEPRQQRLRTAVASLAFEIGSDGISQANSGRGRILRGADLERALARAGVEREPMVDHGLSFARRTDAHGRFYFVNNRSDRSVEGWIPINAETVAATIFDPMTGRSGAAHVRQSAAGALEVYLQIAAGESLIVAGEAQAAGKPFHFYNPTGPAIQLSGSWSVRFLKGGPTLPATRTIDQLVSWTAFDAESKVFSGTAMYWTTFPAPAGAPEVWQLDLGRVHESARVRLNGRNLGTLIGPRFQVVLDRALLGSTNVLEIEVTNLSANRIADLDRRGVGWKKFYNVNMPARLPENRGADGLFTAAKWEPLDSGLLGPVILTPVSPRREPKAGGSQGQPGDSHWSFLAKPQSPQRK